MVNKNVLSCLLKDGKEVNAVMLVGRLLHARATVTLCSTWPVTCTAPVRFDNDFVCVCERIGDVLFRSEARPSCDLGRCK